MDLNRYRQLYADYQHLDNSFQLTGNAFAIERFQDLRSMVFSLRVVCFPCKVGVPLCKYVSHWVTNHDAPYLPMDQFEMSEGSVFVRNAAVSDINELYALYRRIYGHYSYLEGVLKGDPLNMLKSTATFVFGRELFCGNCKASFVFGRIDAHALDHLRPIPELIDFSEHDFAEDYVSDESEEAESVENPWPRDLRRDSDERAEAESANASWGNCMKKLWGKLKDVTVSVIKRSWAILKDTAFKMVAKHVVTRVYGALTFYLLRVYEYWCA